MGCWGRITYRNGSYNIKIHAEFSPKTYGVFQARDWSHAKRPPQRSEEAGAIAEWRKARPASFCLAKTG